MANGKKHYRRGRRSRKRGFASWSLGKKIGAVLGGTVALVAVTGAVIIASKLSKIDTQELDAEALNVSEEAKERGTGYLNVALFGVDSRENKLEKGTLSDTIMIASLNRETMEVKISSVYRDTLLDVGKGELNKANAAYSFGGPEQAIGMLNKNLDMDIEHYVTVNFNSMIDVIDAVGGIEIDVQQEEISYICGYATEIMKVTGAKSPGVTEPGLQTLNGVQATAYARIRYTSGGDYRRTERQREVLTKIVEKLQGASMSQLNKIIDKVFPEVSTNFTLMEILEYAKDAFDYKLGETVGFPFDKTTDTLNNIGSVVIPVDFKNNVVKLHQFFYGDTDTYTPSSNVSNIADKIVAKVGERKADTDDTSSNATERPETDTGTTTNKNNTGTNNGASGGTGGSSNTGGGTTGGGTTGGSTTGGGTTGGSTTGGGTTGGGETGGGTTGGGTTGGETGGGETGGGETGATE